MYNKILILDFGSQVTQLIARRIRELNVYCEIQPCDISEDFIKKYNPNGIILSGGPNSVYAIDTLKVNASIFKLNIPILGICYGMQIMASTLGGVVTSSDSREFGYAEIFNCQSQLLSGIVDGDKNTEPFMQVWMSHGDKVTTLPTGFRIIASNESCPIAAMADEKRNFYGVQFHPEVTHTKQGTELLRRFVIEIAKCTPNWNMPNYAEIAIDAIKQKVGNDKVILALSGGVDSSVAAVMIDKAIGKNLICIFVDNGLLRHQEAEQVMTTYQQHMGLNLIKIDAKEEFYNNLSGVTDPEQKRKIVGRLFVEIFQREAQKLPDAKWLAQGTIYPDVIESAGSNKAHTIKSHHNVGGLPESLHLQLLEPLRELFKDEVRSLGLSLGLPREMIFRHPFPGPGLAVRILGEIKSEYYDYVIALRAVETNDFMTASVADLPFTFVTMVANRIINEVKGINRVVYDISGKPPATIEWE